MFALCNQVRTTLTELKLNTICPVASSARTLIEPVKPSGSIGWTMVRQVVTHAAQIQEANSSLWGEWFTKGSDEKCNFFFKISI